MGTATIAGWHRVRATALGALAVLAAVAGGWLAWQRFLVELHRLGQRSAIRTLDALPVLWWAALLLTLLWAAVLIALAAGSVARTGRGGSTPTGSGAPVPPGLVGRLTVLLLAVTAFSSVSATTPALASTTSSGVLTATVTHSVTSGTHDTTRAETATDSCAAVPLPGWVPDKPGRTDQVARDCAPLVTGKPVADDSGEVVVHRGDTLWSIAAAHLGPDADARAIAAEWPRWYAANKHTIGDDPDLLMIGIRLQSPDHALEGTSR